MSTRTYGLIRISLSCAFPSRPLSFRYTNGLRTVDAPALMLLSAQRNMTDLGDVLREEAKKVVVSHRGGASAYLSYLRLRISVSCSLAYVTCYTETMEETMTAPLSRGIGSRVLRWLSVYPLGFRSSSLLCLRPGFSTANSAVSSFLSVISLFTWAALTYLQEEVSWEQWCARPSVPLPTHRLLMVARQDNQRRDPPAVRPRWVRALPTASPPLTPLYMFPAIHRLMLPACPFPPERQKFNADLASTLTKSLQTMLTHASSERGRSAVPLITNAQSISPFPIKVSVKVGGVEVA